MISLRQRSILEHATIIAMVALGYIAIRVVLAPAIGPLRSHGTDVLAGVALPSLFALFWPEASSIGRWCRTLIGKLALTASAAFVWEVAVPLFSSRSTPDPIDVVAYLAGTLVQHVLVSVVAPTARRPA